jgi:UDP-N-acetylmuramate dehydrogenase
LKKTKQSIKGACLIERVIKMNQKQIKTILFDIYKTEEVVENQLMSEVTSFKVGGPVDFMVYPNKKCQVVETIKSLAKCSIPFMLIGNGSNLLVSDRGIEGVVINTSKGLRYCYADGEKLITGAGATLAQVTKVALSEALVGMEFAAGIPGSVGGAVAMNAGAYGGEIKDVLEKVEVVDNQGLNYSLSLAELAMGYRTSKIQTNKLTVLEAIFDLKKGDVDKSKNLIQELAQKRKDKQPLEWPSAGSVFKRPEGYFAGKLIQDAGLKGMQIGGAQVSEKHSGFIINKGNATAEDVVELVKFIQEQVKLKFNVELEAELKIIGR